MNASIRVVIQKKNHGNGRQRMATAKGKHLEERCKQFVYTSVINNKGFPEMYASIFNAPGKTFRLVIHTTPALESRTAELTFASKAEAKVEAKARGLKAWNY